MKKALKISAVIFLVMLTVAACIWSYISQLTMADRGGLSVYFFDVGQADAALVLWEDGAILFDAGTVESSPKLSAYLSRLGVGTLDCAVFSHPHDDHIGGAETVFEEINVKSVLMPDLTANDVPVYETLLSSIEAEQCTVYEAVYGRRLEFGDVILTVLSGSEVSGDLNMDSAVVKLTYKGVSFLFTGDLEGEAETSIVTAAGGLLDADVLKVGHHGSGNGTSEEFLNAVTPDIAVISCALDNDYGHPHADVITRLTHHGVEIHRTDTEDMVLIESDGKAVWVRKK